jgi:hypothetical protein
MAFLEFSTNHNFLILSYPNTKQEPSLLRLQLSLQASELPSSKLLQVPAFVDTQPKKTRNRPLVDGTDFHEYNELNDQALSSNNLATPASFAAIPCPVSCSRSDLSQPVRLTHSRVYYDRRPGLLSILLT